jgi:hypothetical protein
MIKPLLLPLLLVATPLHAENIKKWSFALTSTEAPSYVHLHEPMVSGAVATVTFRNANVHSMDETFTLTYAGLDVYFLFDWQYMGTQDERLTVEPPPGYVAVPYEIVVPENGVDYVHIYKWEGM